MKRFSTMLLIAMIANTVACGYTKKPTTPAVAGAQPTITGLTPNSMTSGSTAFVLTVDGANFSATATINWNGAAQPTTHNSATQLTTTIPAADVASQATIPVTVTNPAAAGTGAYGSGGTLAETSPPMNFTVN